MTLSTAGKNRSFQKRLWRKKKKKDKNLSKEDGLPLHIGQGHISQWSTNDVDQLKK